MVEEAITGTVYDSVPTVDAVNTGTVHCIPLVEYAVSGTIYSSVPMMEMTNTGIIYCSVSVMEVAITDTV